MTTTCRVVEAMDKVFDPTERVLTYIDVNLQLVAEGEHAIVGALATFTPQAFSDESMHAMHQDLALPLVEALRARGVADPELVTAFVHKVTELIESGRKLDEVRSSIRRVLTTALS